MKQQLERHDLEDSKLTHQAMILTQTKDMLNAATKVKEMYNSEVKAFEELSEIYISGSSQQTLVDFKSGRIRTLIVIGRLLEGFDHNPISVVGIARNVQPASRVLFAQFVGRAVRKAYPTDPVRACIVAHKSLMQRRNWEAFETLPEDDNADSDE